MTTINSNGIPENWQGIRDALINNLDKNKLEFGCLLRKERTRRSKRSRALVKSANVALSPATVGCPS